MEQKKYWNDVAEKRNLQQIFRCMNLKNMLTEIC